MLKLKPEIMSLGYTEQTGPTGLIDRSDQSTQSRPRSRIPEKYPTKLNDLLGVASLDMQERFYRRDFE